MKTTRQRLLNIVITMSAAINIVMLGGLGYIATVDNEIKQLYVTLNSPVVIYMPKATGGSGLKTSLKPLATP